MPADANIILSGARGYQPPQSPLESYAKVMTLRDMADRRRLREEQVRSAKSLNDQRQFDLDEEKSFRDAIGRGASDAELRKTSPKLFAALRKSDTDHQTGLATLDEKQLTVAAKRAELFGSILNGVNDGPSFERGLQSAVEAGLMPPERAKEIAAMGWNEQTAAMVAQRRKEALTVQQEIDNALNERREKRDQADHDATIDGKRAESTQKTLNTLGQAAGAAETPEQYNAALEAAGAKSRPAFTGQDGTRFPAYGDGNETPVSKMVSQEYSPAAVEHASNLGTTPAQRTTAKGQKETRFETRRHNKVLEGQGDARVKQGAERNQIARDREKRVGAGGESGVDRRARQNRIYQLQNEHDALDKQEQEIWRRVRDLEELRKVGQYRDKSGKAQYMEKGAGTAVASELKGLRDKAAQVNSAKKEKLKQKELTRSGQLPAEPGTDDYGHNVAPPKNGAVGWQTGNFRHTATGANGRKIGSHDGQTWFDLNTGERLQ